MLRGACHRAAWSLSSGAHSRDPLASTVGSQCVETMVALSARRHHVGVDPAARNRRLPDAAAVIARHHDWIALGIDTADHADMSTAAATSHYRDSADPRSGPAP